MMKRLILIIAIAAIAASCNRYDITEVLLQRQDISLTWKGNLQMQYVPDKCQIGYSCSTGEFRVYDDMLGNWFIVRCSRRPSYVGEKLKADVEWTTHNDTKTVTEAEFTVEKTDSKGQVWMWCQAKKIGIVMRIPEGA